MTTNPWSKVEAVVFVVPTQGVTITKVPPAAGSRETVWNVDVDDRPFGQIWTFRDDRYTQHRFHAKTLKDEYENFATYAEAEAFIRSKM